MHLNAQVQGRHTHMGRMGPTHGPKPKNSKKGRRETSIFVNGHLKGAVRPIRPWVLANPCDGPAQVSIEPIVRLSQMKSFI